MIRPATHDDVPALVSLGRLLHDTSSYAGLGYDDEKVSRQCKLLIDGAGAVFVSQLEDEVVGFIGGGVTEHWFSGEKVAFDYSFFVHPQHRHGVTAVRLICAFETWAKSQGAVQIRMGITTAVNVQGTTRLFKALGFDDAGVLFSKGLSHGN